MSNKYISGSKSIFNGNSDENLMSTNFFKGIVLSNNDPNDAGRIKVRIKGVDDSILDGDLPFCFPMLQKFFHVTPKVGEVVFILIPSAKNPYSDRVFFGPIVSQPQMLFKDTYLDGATSMLNSGFMREKPSPSSIPENKGVSPNKEDVAIQGRDNSDLIFKPNEVVIRAGKFEAANGGTVFITSHIMSDIDQLCDRVAFIVDGKISEIDSPRNLKIKYGKRSMTLEYKENNETIRVEYPLDGIGKNKEFLDLLQTKDIETLHSGETTLEDIFIKVTGVKLRNEE